MLDIIPRRGVHLIAVCHDCRHQHEILTNGQSWLQAAADWEHKHRLHRIEFKYPEESRSWRIKATLDLWLGRLGFGPRWLEYVRNANVKTAYSASAAVAIDLSSLASSSTLVAGRESTAIDNTSNLYLDHHLAGLICNGTTPTASKEIRTYLVGPQSDTVWPDVFDGTDSAETVTTAAIRDSCCKLASVMVPSTTSNEVNPFGPVSARAVFGGIHPKKFSVFVTHSSVAALHATAGNHVITVVGEYETVT